MRILETYSHLNGEEYLIARQPELFKEIKTVIAKIDCEQCLTKKSREKTMPDKMLIAPKALNRLFDQYFTELGWMESVYRYHVTTNRKMMEELLLLDFRGQREYLLKAGVASPIVSYKQTDFVKNRVAVEVQFGKCAFVAFDLFVKHLLFYSGDFINVGVEVLPMKSMLKDPAGGRRMSTGIAYYEGEVYNILRHGRSSPPVPLLIIGVGP